ncbi:MAG: hypothetical protein ACLQGV_12610 [Bryobacteraceae bacterium]
MCQPVVQGAYKWFYASERGDDQQVDVFQGSMCADLPLPQLELFTDLLLDNGAVFRQLVDQWRAERGATSSTTEILMCPAYQQIIGMGSKAIPLILGEMESEGDDPDQWFWALQVLSGENPVPEEDEGNFKEMAEHWIGWARKRFAW